MTSVGNPLISHALLQLALLAPSIPPFILNCNFYNLRLLTQSVHLLSDQLPHNSHLPSPPYVPLLDRRHVGSQQGLLLVSIAALPDRPNQPLTNQDPPVVAKGYQPKGEYKTIGGLKTYVTGPESASKAILVIYDIFGFFDQTLQGADILAHSSTQKYRVFIPDFFEGSPAHITWFPPQTDDHKQKLGHFFQTKAAPPNNLPKIPGIVSDANKLASGGGFESWSILGYCWGGKIATLATGQDNSIFKAAVQCHPAMLDPEDAKKVTVPMAVLASKDEKPEDVEKFGNNLGQPGYVETFPTQIHGWMAARSNLEDEEVKKEYERGYKTALGFLEKYA